MEDQLAGDLRRPAAQRRKAPVPALRHTAAARADSGRRIQSHLRRWLYGGQRQPLRAQHPVLLEFMLAYYPEAVGSRFD
jgi:hypothetical protein